MTGHRRCFATPLFLDAIGGTQATLAGASWRVSRQGRAHTAETLAPPVYNQHVLGGTPYWRSVHGIDGGCLRALPINETTSQHAFGAGWNREAGLHRDIVLESEAIRDYLLRVIHGNWA